MSDKFIKNKNYLSYLILSIIIFVTAFIYLPVFQGITRDSGMGAYMGQQILNGKILYLDMWDHKPPAIYYFVASSFLIFGDNVYAIWILDVIYTFFIIFIFYKLIFEIFFSQKTSLLASLVFLILIRSTNIYDGGNFTEYYALAPSAGALFLLVKYFKTNKNYQLFFIGVLSTVAFLFRQNAIAVVLAIIIYLPLYFWFNTLSYKELFLKLKILFFGIITACVPVLLYFLYHDALNNFYSDVWIYNKLYINVFHFSLIFQAIKLLFSRPIIAFIMSASLIIIFLRGVVGGIINKFINDKRIYYHILITSAVALFFDIIFLSLSGRFYNHYFISITLPFSIFFAHSFNFVDLFLLQFKKLKNFILPLVYLLLFIFIAKPFYLDISQQYKDNFFKIKFWPREVSLIENYILQETGMSDKVMVWGAESKLNFLTKRASPTRYHYIYPLQMPNYNNENNFSIFMNDIIENKPKLILDASMINNVIPPINQDLREKWRPASNHYSWNKFDDFYEYVSKNYKEAGVIDNYIVYYKF